MKRQILCAATALAALLAAGGTVDAGTATGCLLKNGRMVHIAVGDAPLRKCPRNAREVALGMQDPKRLITFHEVLRFGETLTIREPAEGPDRYFIEGSCSSSEEGRGVGLYVYYSPAVMSIHDDGETVISGITEGIMGAGYNLPHMYEMAAKKGVVDLMDSNGDRLRVEAVLVVGHQDCVLSGTVEEFVREGS